MSVVVVTDTYAIILPKCLDLFRVDSLMLAEITSHATKTLRHKDFEYIIYSNKVVTYKNYLFWCLCDSVAMLPAFCVK